MRYSNDRLHNAARIDELRRDERLQPAHDARKAAVARTAVPTPPGTIVPA